MEVLAEYILELIAAGFLAVVYGLIKSYVPAALEDRLKEIVAEGVQYGKKKARAQVKDKASLDFENKAIDEAVNYVDRNAPKLLKKVGVDKDWVQDLVEAYLSDE